MDKENLLFNPKVIHTDSEIDSITSSRVKPICRTSPFITKNTKRIIEAETGGSKIKISTNLRYVDPIANSIRHTLLKMMKLSE